MKRASTKKPIVEQKAKETLISARTSAPAKKENSRKFNNSAAKSKTQKIMISAPTRKIKNNNSQEEQISALSLLNVAPKTAEPKVSKTTTKKTAAKSQTVVSAKKKPVVKHQKAAGKLKTEKPVETLKTKKIPATKVKLPVSAKKKSSQNEKANQVAEAQKTKKLRINAAIKKAKTVKSQTSVKKENSVQLQPKILTKKVQPKISEKKPKIANIKSKDVVGKKSVKKDISNKRNRIQESSVKSENKKSGSRISKIAKIEDQKIVEVHLVKKLKLPVGAAAPKSKIVGKQKKIKSVELKAEPPVLTAPKPQPKKAKAISSAVFRGAKSSYDFTVFPLDAVFENVPAIYIISRRVVDKSKKAHHALVCIGQTESLLEELKKHKKDKRAKKFAANSISLLREENENRRLKIETDLKAAHAIRCLYA